MQGFGVHTSLWSPEWTRDGAGTAIAEAARYRFDFVEIALLAPAEVDADHTRALLDRHEMKAVCSLGLPADAWASRDPEAAMEFLDRALDVTAAIGGQALSGVIYGGIGERTGAPPTRRELDNVARVLAHAARRARALGLGLGIEPVNRYESHILNTGAQAADMIERVGEDIFIHLDTYHMNIEEKGIASGILAARAHLRYIHLSESDRGVPGHGTCGWDEIFAALAAIGFEGGMAMESFVTLPPQMASALSVWRPVAESADQVLAHGLPFLRGKARQYGLTG